MNGAHLPKPPTVEVGQRWRHVRSGYCLTVEEDRGSYVVLRNDNGRMGTATGLCADDGWEYLGMTESGNVGESVVIDEAPRRGLYPDPVERLKEAMSEPGAIVVPLDPKAEARRALEATAKRLIANPPAWAYPKAWMMAVLRQVERRIPADQLAREFAPRFCFYEELRLYQARRSVGQTHDAAKAGLNLPELCDVYARGMDIRAKPLLVRPVGIGRVR